MIQLKRKQIALLLLFALFCAGCGKKPIQEEAVPLGYTGSQSYEYYDVGNDRNADFLTGRGAEVSIPAGTADDAVAAKEDYVYGLYRLSDRKVLCEHGLTEQIYPASTTKLLTALVALKYCNISETVTISYNASHIGIPGAMLCGFNEGDTIMLGDLLTALLVYSGNDAGIAIAEHVAGSEEAFAEMMNEEARKLGAVDTHFVNSHGLHKKDHYTTAYDIYLIMNELIHYNSFLSIVSMPSCEIHYSDKLGNPKVKSFNSSNLYFEGLFKVPEGIEIIGGKTGTTGSAGCCLILYFKDEKGVSYIAEVFHAPTYEALYMKMTELMKQTASY
ncbi:MAG: D-alanyl-D-alanine carboxypeptidase [Lachnospiraceae bacterium]|nr:D-alanyl-D-alanine carboxypeptidase [Lachnospiraceae bacterium]